MFNLWSFVRVPLALLLVPVLLILSPGCQSSSKNDAPPVETIEKSGRRLTFGRTVSFISEKGDVVSQIKAAEAKTEQERNAGLMDISELEENKGMIFYFDEERPRSFWMANTPLSLDILFIGADSTIVRIHHSTQPFSEKTLESVLPAQFVVEVNGGYCVSKDIREGFSLKF